MIAEDICATQPLPPFPASIKDGYAVIGQLRQCNNGGYHFIACTAADDIGVRTVLDPVTAGDEVLKYMCCICTFLINTLRIKHTI